jgi:hypothetical protein
LVEQYGLKAILCVHTMIGSQNGLDNSGQVVWLIAYSNTSVQHVAPTGSGCQVAVVD